MTYTHITYIPGQPERSREISEAEMIEILSSAMLLMQAGGGVEWKPIEAQDDNRIIRYEMTVRSPFRNPKGPSITIHQYIPNEV